MRPRQPRLAPIDPASCEGEVKELFESMPGDGPVLNIFRTLAHHPKLMKRWLVFGNHVLAKSSLSPREREILILRVGWLCRAEYEWGQHVQIGRASGLSDTEIERIARGPDAPGWAPFEATLLRAVDELHGDFCISDATWQALAERYDEAQLLDTIFTVGQYTLVSMALNSCGVQREQGVPGLPDL